MTSSSDNDKVVAMTSTSTSASLEVTGGDGKRKSKGDRHCAFCLTLTPGEKVQLCGKCKKRAYCSKECQTADWKSSKKDATFTGKIYGFGQAHKDWCGLPYGEEDLDWKVAPISGKGLGLIALRDLPPSFRILVEGMQQPPKERGRGHHPGISDLTPTQTPNLAMKFKKNVFICGSEGPRIGMRASRINHSCKPNAELLTHEPYLPVFMVYSNREIHAGEEICISYLSEHNFPLVYEKHHVFKTPSECRGILLRNWGITCPSSCICRTEKYCNLLEECEALRDYCLEYSMETSVLSKYEELLEKAKELEIGAENFAKLCLQASELAEVERLNNQERGYGEMWLDLKRDIFHPKIVKSLDKLHY